MRLHEAIVEAFGDELFENALFYAYPGENLRFELAEGGTRIDQFLCALSKAVTIAEDVFAGADHFVLCVRHWEWQSIFSCRSRLRSLGDAGLTIPREREIVCEPRRHVDEDGEALAYPYRWNRLVFKVPIDRLRTVLWCALAPGCGIEPAIGNANVYLINMQSGVAMFPYDDRGMDVVGTNGKFLKMLYRKHHRLLLGHDLERMVETFGPLQSVDRG